MTPRPPDRTPLTEAEIDALVLRARVPAIAMLRTPHATDAGTPGCWFGGEPTLPPEIDWPVYVHPYAPHEGFQIPMHFLVQINLEHVPRVLGLPALPGQGTLFVFYDPAVAPVAGEVMGEPDAMVLGLGLRVLHVEGDVSAMAPRTPQPMPDLTGLPLSLPFRARANHRGLPGYTRWPFTFMVVDSYPTEALTLFHQDCYLRAWDFLTERNDALQELVAQSDPSDPTLGEFRGVHTLFGASTMYRFPTAEALPRRWQSSCPPLTPEHVLLFRFPADHGIGHDYDEQHPLSFWITRDHLAEANFDHVVAWRDL